jgi:hypothetical protein
MQVKQLPWLASALCMTAGLYLLAGPFRADRSDVAHLLPLWAVLTLYEAVVIAMIAVLRPRGVDVSALTIVSLFFLADPIFLGDAFSSVSAQAYSPVHAAAGILALVKAWGLARACGFSLIPRQAAWLGAALVAFHQIPALDSLGGATDGSSPWPQAVSWLLAGLSVPLYRSGKLGRAAVAALGIHFTASLIVASLPFQRELLSGLLAASAALLPWPRFGWIPLPLSLYCSPLRPRLEKTAVTTQGWGMLLVGVAFLLLGVGFWRSLRTAPKPQVQS